MLIVAAVVTALLQHWLDAGVIFGVVFINAIIGFVKVRSEGIMSNFESFHVQDD